MLEIKNALKIYQEFGIDEVIMPEITNYMTEKEEKLNSISEIIEESQRLADSAKNIEELKEIVENFNGCSLKKTATNTVFADGDVNSDIMIIGEAPGNHEDLQGKPFCGDSGKLLDSMFNAIDIPREKLYITNTIFWRPPGNRKPTENELAICKAFLDKHIQLKNPKLIVIMGATAMSSILKIKDPISNIRGKFIDYSNQYLNHNIKTITLFHPSYLMRRSINKKLAWFDLLKIKIFLER